ncbi:unnamed protein product [Calicophoron daubneyi]|uniref:EIF3j n=1 Tax=Calicophoron daubneyi TaxID=300641 RepID=A0AAV2T6Y5_CALDB
MGDWDDEEADDVVAKKLNDEWDDDVGDSVPDSWDAVEVKPPEPEVHAPAPAKLSLAERIRLKEEKKRKEREERLKQQEEIGGEANATSELEREKIAEEAELGLLKDTFGSESKKPEKNSLDFAEPNTKEEFNKLNEFLREKLAKLEKSPHYAAFAETLIRDAMTGVDVDTLKSVSTTITAFISEKQKLTKGKSKKKGKGKLIVERENDYGVAVDDVGDDDYEDFM